MECNEFSCECGDGKELIKALIIIARDEMHVSRKAFMHGVGKAEETDRYKADVIQLKELICDMTARYGTTCQDWDDIGADGKDSVHWLGGYPHM